MQILTILEPSTTDLEPTSHSTDNTGLTAALVSAAMAGANKPGLELLIGQVCGRADISALHDVFYPEVESTAKRLNWRLRASDAARAGCLLRIVIVETLLDKKCPSCRGTKYSKIEPSKHCRTCKGTGVWVMHDFAKAEYIGISPAAFSKTWIERQEELKYLLGRRIYQAVRRIKLNLWGEC